MVSCDFKTALDEARQDQEQFPDINFLYTSAAEEWFRSYNHVPSLSGSFRGRSFERLRETLRNGSRRWQPKRRQALRHRLS